MIHKIIGWIAGYVQIEIPADRGERFLNLCRSRGLTVWAVHFNKQEQKFLFYMSRVDYYKIRPIVKKTRTFPLIVGRRGGFFWLQWAMRRKSFWVGIGCFLALLFFLSTRVWGIYVEGESYHSEETVLEYLDSEKIYGGIAVNSVVCSQVEDGLRKHFSDIGWASIEKSGSKLFVRVREINILHKKRKKAPADLVSNQNGKVISIVTTQGTAKVRENNKVKKNQVLISGVVKIIGDDQTVIKRRRVHASGTVVVQSVLSYSDVLPISYNKKIYTGRKRSIYEWKVFGKEIFLYNPLKNLETYKKYDIIRKGGRLCPFLSLRFPLAFWKQEFLETSGKQAVYKKAEAERILTDRFQYFLEQKRQKKYRKLRGRLTIVKEKNCYRAKANVQYERVQNSYRDIPKKEKKEENKTDGNFGNRN